jgi:hypothetical protein
MRRWPRQSTSGVRPRPGGFPGRYQGYPAPIGREQPQGSREGSASIAEPCRVTRLTDALKRSLAQEAASVETKLGPRAKAAAWEGNASRRCFAGVERRGPNTSRRRPLRRCVGLRGALKIYAAPPPPRPSSPSTRAGPSDTKSPAPAS